MNVRTTTNVHLTPDTRVHVRQFSTFLTIEIEDSIFIYVHDENQLAEIMQACDQAAKMFS